ncbi:hypothetical protein D9K78_02200 [Klebsiella pneumoniae]|uniref:ead/Ea22-like family protein n=1 Tax=Klebsiella pneumoniae complex TaxID=3390273 RepID=UPI000EF20F85|nr:MULTISPECIES: ead/Ea22-like family protein [Klebsiella]MCP6453107.1 ead/Ea22-like family protein [Klebsiella pneumoniae]MEA5438642.1 ead/Ea22-like family protein [Klebsiella variicola]RLL15004.1 hypothetical protein D9K78_02200 [Klebsiella pneumoniae]HDK6287948.1 ead/Ea22-like family protein [Klebsiella variicola]
MTDITELAQSLKAAAVRVIKNYDSEWFEAGRQICTVHKSKINLISLANPANVLALVEALESEKRICATWRKTATAVSEKLEKAQQCITELKSGKVGNALLERENHHVEVVGKLTERIAELESRTVTVNLASRRLPSDYVDGEFSNDDLAAIHNACRLECKVIVEKYLSAHGIVVKWEAE